MIVMLDEQDRITSISLWHPFDDRWVYITQIIDYKESKKANILPKITHKYYTDGVEVQGKMPGRIK